MCFKNLPIEFDADGKPFLRAGVANPYGPSTTMPRGVPAQLTAERIEDLLRRNGYIKNLDFDPVTRVAGALAFHTVADFKARKVLEARSVATLFRGYEVIMVGRDPRDAIYITSRACGVCGGVHSTTSAMAIEMAIGCVPPPLGVLVRNLALALSRSTRWPTSSRARCWKRARWRPCSGATRSSWSGETRGTRSTSRAAPAACVAACTP